MAKMRFYFDEMMPRPAANELTKRGYDVVMAVDVGMMEKDDTAHLQFAGKNGLTVVTEDRAFAGKVSRQAHHSGLICWTGIQGAVGSLVRVLSEFAEMHTAEQVAGRVFWLK